MRGRLRMLLTGDDPEDVIAARQKELSDFDRAEDRARQKIALRKLRAEARVERWQLYLSMLREQATLFISSVGGSVASVHFAVAAFVLAVALTFLSMPLSWTADHLLQLYHMGPPDREASVRVPVVNSPYYISRTAANQSPVRGYSVWMDIRPFRADSRLTEDMSLEAAALQLRVLEPQYPEKRLYLHEASKPCWTVRSSRWGPDQSVSDCLPSYDEAEQKVWDLEMRAMERANSQATNRPTDAPESTPP